MTGSCSDGDYSWQIEPGPPFSTHADSGEAELVPYDPDLEQIQGNETRESALGVTTHTWTITPYDE
jgi:hypothetical protein